MSSLVSRVAPWLPQLAPHLLPEHYLVKCPGCSSYSGLSVPHVIHSLVYFNLFLDNNSYSHFFGLDLWPQFTDFHIQLSTHHSIWMSNRHLKPNMSEIQLLTFPWTCFCIIFSISRNYRSVFPVTQATNLGGISLFLIAHIQSVCSDSLSEKYENQLLADQA